MIKRFTIPGQARHGLFGLGAALALHLPLAAGAATAATSAAGSAGVSPRPASAPAPGYALFGGQPLAFERSGGKIVAAYVPQWASPGLLAGLPKDNVTHLIYAFLHACGPGMLPADAARCEGRADFELARAPVDERFEAAFAAFKARAPHVKVLASVGGWGGSDPFFHLAGVAERRAVFAASAADFLRRHPSFDGIDIDWEHPTSNGSANGVALGSPADGPAYADLMQALRAALDRLSGETGRPYLLTSAINTSRSIIEHVDMKRAAQSMDLVFMMSYDFHGGWTPTVGNHAALRPARAGQEDGLTAATDTLRAAGVPPSKLVAGVAMYARGFRGVPAPAPGQGLNGLPHQGVQPGPEGEARWREIAGHLIDAQGRGRHGWATVYDPASGSWDLWNARQGLYLGYDDPRTVLAKGAYVRAQGLAGVFAWELSQDNGDLLNAMNAGVGNSLLAP